MNSEQGFFHPSIGYWQTSGEPPQEILDTYPVGTTRIPLKPGGSFVWSGSEWAYAAGDVVAARADKWTEIKEQRDAAISQPKATSHGTFDAKPADQDNLNKVISLTSLAIEFGQPDAARYTLATNERVTFTLAQLKTAALEIGAQTQAIYDQADALRAQIEAATTAELVRGIQWPTS